MLSFALALAQAVQSQPGGPTVLDRAFAYGAVVLLVALVVWQGRDRREPPRS